MPWTVDDVESHKKGLTDKQKRQWVRIANSVLARCIAKGGTDKTCAPSAIKQANGVVGNNQQYGAYRTTPQVDYEVQFTVHQGKAHMIVPVVMMVEGVHAGSQGAILHPMDELGRVPDAWNGIPVIIYHPAKDGVNVSANSPDIIDNQVVGRVYHTKVDDNKLKAEVWFDEEKLSDICPEVLQRVNNREAVEVSVGVFTDNEDETGIWNGEEYQAIAHNHRPDHLAVLPNSVGACSCADGCGLGANAMESNTEEKPTTKHKLHVKAKKVSDVEDEDEDDEEDDDEDIDDNQEYKFKSGKVELEDTLVGVQMDYVANRGVARTKFSTNLKNGGKMAETCAPCVQKKVDELIANSQGKWTEEHREFLQSLDEAILDKMAPTIVEKEVQVNVLSDEDKAALATYKAEQKAKREQLIADIQANTSKELWPDETLKAMNDDMLKRVYTSVKKVEKGNYSLNGANAPLETNAADEIEPLTPTGIKF